MSIHLRVLGMAMLFLSVALPLYAEETPSDAPSTDTATEEANDVPLPAFPSNCEPLPLVGGEGSEVSKEISPPAVNIPLPGPLGVGTRNNWNTDWYIPSGVVYDSYQVIFMPRSDREYDVAMYVKYPDDTNQQFYNEARTSYTANEPVVVDVTPDRTDIAPYQINVSVGGVQAVGARYSVSVAGCSN